MRRTAHEYTSTVKDLHLFTCEGSPVEVMLDAGYQDGSELVYGEGTRLVFYLLDIDCSLLLPDRNPIHQDVRGLALNNHLGMHVLRFIHHLKRSIVDRVQGFVSCEEICIIMLLIFSP